MGEDNHSRSGRPSRSGGRGRIAGIIIGAIVFILGIALLLWRPVTNWVTQRQMDERIASVQQTISAFENGSDDDGSSSTAMGSLVIDGTSSSVSGTSDTATASTSDVSADTSAADSATSSAEIATVKPTASLRGRFEAYNQQVREGTAGTVNDPFTTSDPSTLFGQLSDGPIGSVEIPAMDCYLPLYLGASAENMALGADVVSGTSIPLGETSSNSVIAAHRGWYTSAMFRDIEKLQVEDDVWVTNPWERLHYRVIEMRVVGATDLDAVAIQPGRDLVTLLTCHPYGVVPAPNRMLVLCERVYDEDEMAGSAAVDSKVDVDTAVASVSAQTSSRQTDDKRGSQRDVEDDSTSALGTISYQPSMLLQLENALATVGWAIAIVFIVGLCVGLVRRRHRRNRKSRDQRPRDPRDEQ